MVCLPVPGLVPRRQSALVRGVRCARGLRIVAGVTEPDVGIEERLYGMMQFLMASMAQRRDPEIPAPRNVVELQDALDAVLQMAAVVDEAVQSGRIRRDRGVHAGAMLMIIRDYIRPLPKGLAADGVTDHATEDLRELVGYLRQAREDTGLHG
jgi:hypothetical protein